jgi:hypothetical protein
MSRPQTCGGKARVQFGSGSTRGRRTVTERLSLPSTRASAALVKQSALCHGFRHNSQYAIASAETYRWTSVRPKVNLWIARWNRTSNVNQSKVHLRWYFVAVVVRHYSASFRAPPVCFRLRISTSSWTGSAKLIGATRTLSSLLQQHSHGVRQHWLYATLWFQCINNKAGLVSLPCKIPVLTWRTLYLNLPFAESFRLYQLTLETVFCGSNDLPRATKKSVLFSGWSITP